MKSQSASCISGSAASTVRTRRCTSTDCWRRDSANEWGICGVGVMPADRKMKDVLDAQDGLYTLVLENPDGSPRRAGDRVDRRLPLRARRPRGRDRTACRADHAHRLADHHRGRLQRRAHRPGRSERVRPGGRGPRAAPRPRAGVADDRLVRQHRGQRRRRAAGVHHLRRARSSRAGGVDRHQHALPEFDGGPHHPGHHARGHRESEERLRGRRPVAGGGGAVHVMGARGRFLRRQATAGGRRRAAGRRRHAVRADEAAAAERQPPKPLLLRVSQRVPTWCTMPRATRCSPSS